MARWSRAGDCLRKSHSFTGEEQQLKYKKECLAVIWAATKFMPFLYGRPFLIVSDHHCLCWLACLKYPSGRRARWSLTLQEFDVAIVYECGKRHTYADCLSRAPLEQNPVDWEDDDAALGALAATDLAQKHRDDSELQPLIEHLEGRSAHFPRMFKRPLSSFVLQDGVLFKRGFDSAGPAHLLVVPKCLRDDVLYSCHGTPSLGHLGFARMVARVRQKYYWPKLAATVKHYLTTCSDCQRRKTPSTRPAGCLQPIEPPNLPFQQIG